ncbi:tRNA pseudouridine(55) synthase TruB [Desmospora profundinema]|uniref:tRNA pseudouridine synthase B n=1 Tax=Desmospora profundinema TaxID=1571184 RepID=A0ABU1IJP6_9BACL|nr:tRNA pseudouridine(55) synthase TruB [Desmospora profundinema]MDR6224219.1 tRNA pseudouridine55 synthase [Desmospora profundinema]
MLHGVLPVNKPNGMTSHDVVSQVRRLTRQKRIGHTGTLDPEVKGVLPLCLGQATRIVENVQEMPKRYRGSLVLGVATDTEDQTGRVIEEAEVGPLSLEHVDDVLRRFVGKIHQTPPMYSAVKVGGKRLYEWAREGVEVERPTREVVIHQLERVGFEPGDRPRLDLDVWCSKGTYVRTLFVDIGRELGAPAHLSALVRTQSGPFSLHDSWSLEALEKVAEQGDWNKVLVSIGETLSHLPAVTVTDADRKRVENGVPLPWNGKPLGAEPGTRFRILTESGQCCALYRLMEDQPVLKPEKVFRVR